MHLFSVYFFLIQKFVEIFCIKAWTHHCNVPFGLIKHIQSQGRRRDEACVESSCILTSATWSPSLFEDTGTLFLTPASLPEITRSLFRNTYYPVKKIFGINNIDYISYKHHLINKEWKSLAIEHSKCKSQPTNPPMITVMEWLHNDISMKP